MNINYAEIIEKANARKDALLAFEKAVNNLHTEMTEGVPDIISYCHEYERTYKALDNEAQRLLPGDHLNAAHVMGIFAARMLEAWNAMLTKPYGTFPCTPLEAAVILAGTPE